MYSQSFIVYSRHLLDVRETEIENQFSVWKAHRPIGETDPQIILRRSMPFVGTEEGTTNCVWKDDWESGPVEMTLNWAWRWCWSLYRGRRWWSSPRWWWWTSRPHLDGWRWWGCGRHPTLVPLLVIVWALIWAILNQSRDSHSHGFVVQGTVYLCLVLLQWRSIQSSDIHAVCKQNMKIIIFLAIPLEGVACSGIIKRHCCNGLLFDFNLNTKLLRTEEREFSH